MSSPSPKPSATARKISARLHAVQAVYQMAMNKQDAKTITLEYLTHRAGMTVDDETYVPPDNALFSSIVQGVEEKQQELVKTLASYLKREDDSIKSMEMLLKATLLCGLYELMMHQEIDTPIILNDYIEIAASFYDESAKSIVNAILDNAAAQYRA